MTTRAPARPSLAPPAAIRRRAAGDQRAASRQVEGVGCLMSVERCADRHVVRPNSPVSPRAPRGDVAHGAKRAHAKFMRTGVVAGVDALAVAGEDRSPTTSPPRSSRSRCSRFALAGDAMSREHAVGASSRDRALPAFSPSLSVVSTGHRPWPRMHPDADVLMSHVSPSRVAAISTSLRHGDTDAHVRRVNDGNAPQPGASAGRRARRWCRPPQRPQQRAHAATCSASLGRVKSVSTSAEPRAFSRLR
jgi:hypothetical protein